MAMFRRKLKIKMRHVPMLLRHGHLVVRVSIFFGGGYTEIIWIPKTPMQIRDSIIGLCVLMTKKQANAEIVDQLIAGVNTMFERGDNFIDLIVFTEIESVDLVAKTRQARLAFDVRGFKIDSEISLPRMPKI